jgi:N-acetylmuramoyl-L-alanine amidase
MGCCLTLSAKSARELAAERYHKARVLLEDLDSVPQDELGERQYLLVVDAFKSVHRTTPASSYCDDALLAVGDVYAAMIGRFGADPWRRKAIEAYQYVIQEYPYSNHLEKARSSIAALESGKGATTISKARRQPDPEDEAAEREADRADAAPAPTAAVSEAKAPGPSESAPVASPPPAEARSAPAEGPAAELQLTSVSAAFDGASPMNHAEPSPARMHEGIAQISGSRHYSHPDFTRIVIDVDDYTPYKFDFLSKPRRLYFDLLTAKLVGDIRLGFEAELGDSQIQRIRAGQNRLNKARVVIDLADEVYYDIAWLANPPRLVIDLRGRQGGKNQVLARANEAPATRNSPEEPPAETASVAARPEPEKPKSFQQAFLELAGRKAQGQTSAQAEVKVPPQEDEIPTPAETVLAKAVIPAPPPDENMAAPRAAQATSRGSQSLIRALGLKIGRVVIDAGHGGHDPGNIGPSGLQEKDVVLDVSLRLGKLIESRLGAEVLYTRQDDRFLELSDRPKVANKAQADLFISVHANAYSGASVRGVETFYLNFTTDPWALKVASRENAASNHSVHELQDLLGKIALKEKIDESREFALKMQSSLYGGLAKETAGLRNRGVRQAPLIVLIGAKMPAILTEIGFLSNPTDEKLFMSGTYRDKVAEKIFAGVESYVKTLSSHSLTMTDQSSAAASLD